MDISIIGAGGAIGRQIAISLVRRHILPSHARLQLVGHRGGTSERTLPGIAADLTDAFAEDAPEIEVVCDPKLVAGDVIILAAGATAQPGRATARAALEAQNRAVLDTYARAIARYGHGQEVVWVLTNPVESAVARLCAHLDRKRVIGMGAYLDTLRFRQEIAHELGVRRQRVQGLVLGEHGPRMVPCFSTVSVQGFASAEGRARIEALERPRDPSVKDAVRVALSRMQARGPLAAYQYVDRLGPALRAVVRPYVTQLSGARTPAATAEMIVRLLSTLMSAGNVLTAAQVMLQGEFLGIHGVVGAPITMTLGGVENVVGYPLSARERERVKRAVHRVALPKPSKSRRAKRATQSAKSERVRGHRCTVSLRTSSRPGIAERIASLFADRGINLDSIVAEARPTPRVVLSFRASAALTAFLARRLSRMQDVLRVRVR